MIKGVGKTQRDAQQSPDVIRAGPKRALGLEGALARQARELLLMAAHDLRTPLAVIKMQAERIERRSGRGGDLSPLELATASRLISVSADYAFELVDDLLSVERLPQPKRVGTGRSAIDIEALIAEALARHEELLERAHCKVTLTRDTRLRRASGAWDRGYLLTVFSNLLRNVVRHAPGAPIHIALIPRGDRLGIVFSDRGPGLSSKEGAPQPGQLRTARGGGNSHGFGLWIVRRAVERLKGRVRIHNTPGRGVAFEIELPGLRSPPPGARSLP